MLGVEDFISTAEIKAATYYRNNGLSYLFHDIEDLKQELIIVAWKAIIVYDASKKCTLTTWINRKMDYYVKDFRRRELSRKFHIEYIGDLFDLYALIDRLRQSTRSVFYEEALAEIYDRLTPKQQEIVTLKLQGFTHDEIAQKLGYKDNSGVAKQWAQVVSFILSHKKNKRIS